MLAINMKARTPTGKRRGCFLLIVLFAVIFSAYVEQVLSLPTEPEDQWPTFPRRNIATLAKNGYLRNSGANSYKRSISILAKNGMLPTYRSPYVGTDKQEHEDESQEKRNLASIARLHSYSAMKRNIQALARDGYRMGRGQYNAQNNKRNIAALARNGLLYKRDEFNGDEYYFPFYQNPVPPLSEIDGPFDVNEMYDFQQTINPDMFPPLSQVAKRSAVRSENDYAVLKDFEDNTYLKKGSVGLPAHGLYRPMYRDPTIRTKRYMLSLPEFIETNNIDDKNDNENEDKRSVGKVLRNNFEKRHIGSLARLGLLPSFRFAAGRYSRSGRARKHSADENFGIRQYFAAPEVDAAVHSDDADVPPPPVPPHSHPTGRILHRPLSNDLPNTNPSLPAPPISPPNFVDAFSRNRWQPITKESPKFYHLRSAEVPLHSSGKRYLLLPAVDNILLRKTYRNNSLPSRRKNQ